MRHTFFYLISACFMSFGIMGCAQKQSNVLFVLLDDLGYTDLSCYGGEIPTPNIDELAVEGIRFQSCYNSARCCPSRASLMTGLYPPQAGIADFTTKNPAKNQSLAYLGRLRDDCVTLGEVLGDAGYSTYYVGKWHLHDVTNPVVRGFDEFYGYSFAHSQDQWEPSIYQRLPEGRIKEIDPVVGDFYATDVFTDYAIEFIKQGQKKDKPWFVFLGHSSPHFPIQAPKETIDKYFDLYMKGWDVLREDRFERMKQIGLVNDESWTLTERSMVPVDQDIIANGYSGEINPAWDSLDEDRKQDLARRMATFAAMVDHVDKGMGRIIEYLKKTGQYENTIIMLTSDNGACYEWGPYGFDGVSRKGEQILHKGDELLAMGGPGTYSSYGSAWANLGNTPLRLYKHFTHEGGVAAPFIIHWPQGIDKKMEGQWSREKIHVMDVMPFLCEVTGAEYPAEYNGNSIQKMEGISFMEACKGKELAERSIYFSHQGARAVVKGDWKLVWGKRMPYEPSWELYNLKDDKCETNDLSAKYPDMVNEMAKSWDEYVQRTGINPNLKF